MNEPVAVFGQDPTAASWIEPRLTGAWGHVTGVVPAGFDAYARVLHPVELDDQPPTSWWAVAQAAGTRVHALAQWHRVAPGDRGAGSWWRAAAPEVGNLDAGCLADLLDVLRRHTQTPEDCWFCLWGGYGWIHGSPAVAVLRVVDGAGWEEQPVVPPAFPADVLRSDRLLRLPAREYLVARGPLDAARRIGHQVTADWFEPQSPNLFWPADRTWCVATEIDFDSTLIGGSRELIAELVARDGLEVFRVQPHDSLQDHADRVN